jgi:hypothetical protein
MILPVLSLWLSLNLGSVHTEPGYSNDTRGAGIVYDASDTTRLLAGAYRNSFRGETVYAGAAYLPFGDRLKFGGFVAYASGYRARIGFDALAGGMAEWSVTDRVRLRLVAIPPVPRADVVTASVLLELRFP